MYICIHNLGISFPVILSPGTDLSGALVLRRLCLMRGMDFEEASALLERTGTGGSGAGAASFRWGNGWKMASYGETIGETITI